MNSFSLGLFLLLLLQVASNGQNRWVVGPGGFGTVEAAYQVAAPGDVILLRSSPIPVFTLSGKGVRLIADGPTANFQSGRATIVNVPAGQEMYIENITIDGWLDLANCRGSLVLNRVTTGCTGNDDFMIGLSAFNVATLACIDCYFRGCARVIRPCVGGQTGEGFYCSLSMVTLNRTTIEDGPTGVFSCGMAPNINQYFFSNVVAAIGGGYPGPYHASLTDCVLVGAAVEPLSFSIVNGTVSGLRQGLRASLFNAVVEDYGTNLVASGLGSVVRHGRPLPGLRATISNQVLSLQGTGAEPNSPVAIGVSIGAAVQPFESIGHHGTLVLDLNAGRSSLFDVVLASNMGSWARAYGIPGPIAQALQYQYFIVQGFSLAPNGGIYCSTWDVVRF